VETALSEESAASPEHKADDMSTELKDDTGLATSLHLTQLEEVVEDDTQTRAAKRRAALAGKLRDIFEVPGIEEVVAEIPCYLFRSIR
jgi:hypothetical protein